MPGFCRPNQSEAFRGPSSESWRLLVEQSSTVKGTDLLP